MRKISKREFSQTFPILQGKLSKQRVCLQANVIIFSNLTPTSTIKLTKKVLIRSDGNFIKVLMNCEGNKNFKVHLNQAIGQRRTIHRV